jgi:hypothetical protein
VITRESALAEIRAVEQYASDLADATSLETKLADTRTFIKDAGIGRLIASKRFSSVTAAEKGIEFDDDFMAHREAERIAVADRIMAEGRYEAAKLRARLAIELCAIDEQARELDEEVPAARQPFWFEGVVICGHIDAPSDFEEGVKVRVEKVD